MSPRDVNNGDTDQESPFPEEFEDDLNEDWESAFQADDFMFSQDEETGDFFKPDLGGTEDIDLSSLAESKPEPPASPESAKESDSAEEEKKKKRFIDLPQWQRVCLLTIPLLAVAAVITFILYPRPTGPPGQKTAEVKTESEKPAQAAKEAAKQVKTEAEEETDKTGMASPASPGARSFQPLPDKKIRKRYDLPSIFVTAANSENEAVFVSVDITLLLNMAPDQALSEKEKIRASDIIYQFFKNRPGGELEDYALDRGKMIKGIDGWVTKTWPDGPLESVIINSYRVNKS